MALLFFQEFFDISLEYAKLEKIEIGGLNGRHLSAKVAVIFDEFNTSVNVFRNVSYDPAEPDDPSFIDDFNVFKVQVLDLDRRLAAITSLAWNECHNLDSIFKVTSIVFVLLILSAVIYF